MANLLGHECPHHTFVPVSYIAIHQHLLPLQLLVDGPGYPTVAQVTIVIKLHNIAN